MRDFSNSGIALFRTVTTGIPGLVGLVLGGRLAEVRGRRPIAAVAIAIATATQMVFFLTSGPVIWFMSAVSIIAASAGGIALGTLGTELFPTETRSTSNGLLGVVGVVGSALGFVVTGLLAQSQGQLGRAIAVCGIGSLVGRDLARAAPARVRLARARRPQPSGRPATRGVRSLVMTPGADRGPGRANPVRPEIEGRRSQPHERGPFDAVVLEGLCFPEGPRWHDGRLFFSDQHDHRVVAMDPSGKAETVVEVPNQPSGIGWLPDGRMLVVSMLDRRCSDWKAVTSWSTPISRCTHPPRATTWWSTRRAARTSATSASTCTAARVRKTLRSFSSCRTGG